MKKFKLFIVSGLICAIGYIGYAAYEKLTMTETEIFMLANIEALTTTEPGGGGGNDAPTCAAGGCNATQCSFSGEISVLGNGATYTNSITCEGAWACCFTTAYCFSKSRC